MKGWQWLSVKLVICRIFATIKEFTRLAQLYLTVPMTVSGLPRTLSSPRLLTNQMPLAGMESLSLSASPGKRDRTVRCLSDLTDV